MGCQGQAKRNCTAYARGREPGELYGRRSTPPEHNPCVRVSDRLSTAHLLSEQRAGDSHLLRGHGSVTRGYRTAPARRHGSSTPVEQNALAPCPPLEPAIDGHSLPFPTRGVWYHDPDPVPLDRALGESYILFSPAAGWSTLFFSLAQLPFTSPADYRPLQPAQLPYGLFPLPPLCPSSFPSRAARKSASQHPLAPFRLSCGKGPFHVLANILLSQHSLPPYALGGEKALREWATPPTDRPGRLVTVNSRRHTCTQAMHRNQNH